jgi:hypothetical protein
MLQSLRSRLTFANVVAAACLFVVLGGDSFAAGAAESAAHVITGRGVKNGSLTGADIKDHSLHAADLAHGLAVRGATGPAGATGAAGAKGDRGTAGSPGVSGLQIVSSTSVTVSTGYKQQAVTCPAGKTPISGGATEAASSQPAQLALVASQPAKNGSAASAGDTPDGWFVAMNNGTFTGSWNVTAYAVCAHVTP